jgi:DNA modification methylase
MILLGNVLAGDSRVVYRDNDSMLICARWQDVIGELPKADAVITDPPYGIGSWSSTGGNSLTAEEAEEMRAWDRRELAGDIREVVSAGRYAIVWGGNYFGDALGSTRSPLIWDKGIRGMHFADGEYAWTNFDFGSLRIYNARAVSTSGAAGRLHPTEKPIALMDWCLSLLEHKSPGKVAVDLFCGSGSLLCAAKQRGWQSIGIEASEAYCAKAAKRLAGMRRQLPLWEAGEMSGKQIGLFG